MPIRVIKKGSGFAPVPLPVRTACQSEGIVIERCHACGGAGDTIECDRFGKATRRYTTGKIPDCETCLHHTAETRAGDPKCGIVVGVYKWAALAEVQIRAVREMCGPVPVLVSNDDPQIRDELDRICAKYDGVMASHNPERIGHGGGDLAAFFKGVNWAESLGLEYVCKLSQRLIPLGAYWLQDGAKELALSGLGTATRTTNHKRWPVRSECVLMKVADWLDPAAMKFIEPRAFYTERTGGYDCEMLIWDAAREHVGGAFWPWPMLPPEREKPGPYLWHHSNTPADYHELARRYRLTLPTDFTCAGWEGDYAKGVYKHG